MGGWLKVTCGLTACTSHRDQLWTQRSVTSMGELYHYLFLLPRLCTRDSGWLLGGAAKLIGTNCSTAVDCCFCDDYVPHSSCVDQLCHCDDGYYANQLRTTCLPRTYDDTNLLSAPCELHLFDLLWICRTKYMDVSRIFVWRQGRF